MHRCDAVLLDMDGTLVDSTDLVERLWGDFATRHGLDRVEVVDFAHGRPTAATVEHFVGRDAVDDELARFARDEMLPEGVVAVPGAAGLLAALDGVPTALVTSATRELARPRMALVGLEVPTVLVGSDDVEHGKPDPEPFARAAGLLGVDPARCVALEDSANGLASAAAAGVPAIHVGSLGPDERGTLVRVADLTALTAAVDGSSVVLRW